MVLFSPFYNAECRNSAPPRPYSQSRPFHKSRRQWDGSPAPACLPLERAPVSVVAAVAFFDRNLFDLTGLRIQRFEVHRADQFAVHKGTDMLDVFFRAQILRVNAPSNGTAQHFVAQGYLLLIFATSVRNDPYLNWLTHEWPPVPSTKSLRRFRFYQFPASTVWPKRRSASANHRAVTG